MISKAILKRYNLVLEDAKTNRLAALNSFAVVANQPIFVFEVEMCSGNIDSSKYIRSISELANLFYGEDEEYFAEFSDTWYERSEFESRLASGETLEVFGEENFFFVGKNEDQVHKKFVDSWNGDDDCEQIWNSANILT